MIPEENTQRLYSTLAAIPAGKVVTYGQLAELSGMPKRARWVGQVLKALPNDSNLPWHRVVNAQGRISFPVDTPAYRRQAELLRAEGVLIEGNNKINLQQHRY